MLDPSVVLSKVGSGNLSHTLSPSAPDVIVSGAPGGAVVYPIGGAVVLSATIGNDYVPGAWSAVNSTGQAIPATGRMAFKLGGRDQAPIVVNWA